MEKSHFVIDIETLGHVPGSIILEIGCVEFNPKTGEILDEILIPLDVEDSKRHGFSETKSTLDWWAKQDNFDEVLNRQPRHKVHNALGILYDFLYGGYEAIIWANSPLFDIGLLQAYYDKFDFKSYPWKYWNLRDIRTLVQVTGITKATANTHGALEDCKNQVDWIVQGLKAIER